MNDKDRQLYELALREGNRRFGSACSHAIVRNGTCANCLRKIWPK